MTKIAVILAAGFGSRLKEKTKLKPKGFLEIEKLSLIERSLEKLFLSGIKKVFLGTGYLSEVYEDFAKKYEGKVEIIKNEDFASSGSMLTLYTLRKVIKEDFLLLESDLLYEIAALKYLLEDDRKDIILASGKTNSNDEVYIQADEKHFLQNMSKKKDNLSSIYAELVGITKISYERFQDLCKIFEKLQDKKIDYEYILVHSSKDNPYYVKKIDSLLWCEIDDENHLFRALNNIYPKIKAKDTKIKRNILLNPGPATTSDSVKMAQVVPDICPREKEFAEIFNYVAKGLTSIVADTQNYTTVLFGGSGTAAVEAILTSVIPHDKKVLIINNGAYGKRMCQIASRYKISFVEFKSSPIEAINLEALEDILKNETNLSHLALIHNETTTGLLNNLDDLGKIARKYDLELIVDAMSSYAALPINMKEQNISYLAASSNKNIQGMAGVSFVIANKKSLEALENIEPRTFYLSLYEQYKSVENTNQMRFTPPVQTIYALKQAIIEAKEEGIENRYKRYSKSWKMLTAELKKMGLKYLVEDKDHSKIITSIKIPDNLDFDEMHDYFYERAFTIYPGKVEEFNTFRIANIGQIDEKDIFEFIELLKKYLKEKGILC